MISCLKVVLEEVIDEAALGAGAPSFASVLFFFGNSCLIMYQDLRAEKLWNAHVGSFLMNN